MRVDRIVLEDHGDVALFGLHVVDHIAADADVACGNFLQTCDHAQGGGLAAAGRANQNNELTGLDVQIDAMQDLSVPVGLFEVV